MAVEVRFNEAALRSIAIGGARDDLRLRANRVLNAARRGVPVDRGTLRASLTVQYSATPTGEPVARIGSNLPYAIFVHEGTGIYGPRGRMIRPVKGRFMVWTRGGVTTFARQTKGMRGTPFLVNALEAARG